MNETKTRRENEELEKAVLIVNKAIESERSKLEKIARTDEQSPIMVERETTAGYYCQLMMDPKKIVEILLEYNYPVWKVLGDESPDAMWGDLGRMVGLACVSSVNI